MGAPRRDAGPAVPVGERVDLAHLPRREAPWQQAVDDHRRELALELAFETLLQLDRLGDRHLGAQRHPHVAGAVLVLEQLQQLARLPRDRPDPGDRAEGARRAEHAERVSGGGGVHDHEVIATAALVRRRA